MPKWTMPDWMKPYEHLFADAGYGVEAAMDEYDVAAADFLVTSSGRALSVNAQIRLLTSLRASGSLKEAVTSESARAARRELAGIAASMKLPDGKTCADCAHYEHCSMLISAEPGWTSCDWAPSRFSEKAETTEGRAGIVIPPAASDGACHVTCPFRVQHSTMPEPYCRLGAMQRLVAGGAPVVYRPSGRCPGPGRYERAVPGVPRAEGGDVDPGKAPEGAEEVQGG